MPTPLKMSRLLWGCVIGGDNEFRSTWREGSGGYGSSADTTTSQGCVTQKEAERGENPSSVQVSIQSTCSQTVTRTNKRKTGLKTNKQQQQKTTCINLHQHVVVNLKSKLEFIFADTLKKFLSCIFNQTRITLFGASRCFLKIHFNTK